jgi:hypothetical protein
VNIVLIVALVAVCLLIVKNAVMSPVSAQRSLFEEEMASLDGAPEELSAQAEKDYETFQSLISDERDQWQELIPPPVKEAVRPDLGVMLQGVQPTRTQVGTKIRVITPNAPRGEMFGVGDSVHGVKIKGITPGAVEFSLSWQGVELTHSIARK